MKKFVVIAAALLMFGCGTAKTEASKTAADVNAAAKEADAAVNDAAKAADAAVKDAAADAKAADAAVKDAASDAEAAAADAKANMDKEVVKSVVVAHSADIKACYLDALNRDKDLKGKIVLRWTVQDGAVKASEILRDQSTINDQVMENCILAKVNTWMFPESKGEVNIDYPFEFNTEKPAE